MSARGPESKVNLSISLTVIGARTGGGLRRIFGGLRPCSGLVAGGVRWLPSVGRRQPADWRSLAMADRVEGLETGCDRRAVVVMMRLGQWGRWSFAVYGDFVSF